MTLYEKFIALRKLILLIATVLWMGNTCTASQLTNTDTLRSYTIQNQSDKSVKLIYNNQSYLPLKQYSNIKQTNVLINIPISTNEFVSYWEWYNITSLVKVIEKSDYAKFLGDTLAKIKDGQLFIHLNTKSETDIGQLIRFLKLYPLTSEVTIALYNLKELSPVWLSELSELASAIICAPDVTEFAVKSVVRGVFGGIAFFKHKSDALSIETARTRIDWCNDSSQHQISEKLKEIDSIVKDAIDKKGFPGCQVLAIHNGKVIFEKSFGHHTYDKKQPVTPTDIYDLASLTKILATTPALMLLETQGAISVNDKLKEHLKKSDSSEIGNLTIKAILSHMSGLKSWIPFYKQFTGSSPLDTTVFSQEQTHLFNLKVSDSLFIAKSYSDSMISRILNTPLSKKPKYVYSDLGMILFRYAIEELTNVPFEEYLEANIYAPLNMQTMGYNPASEFPLERIVPTENDYYFRKRLLHGYVHDPAAAMLGGVAGHAGLFANARDVGVLMYTYMNDGKYGGIQIFDSVTISKFNYRYYKNVRRGLGFDKPDPIIKNISPVTRMASDSSFGHSGFTGTYAWADPEKKLVYVFLSNRVHPDQNNGLLTALGVRKKVHEVLYKAIENNKN